MSGFYTNDPVYCPNCPARFRKSNPLQRVGVHLECTVTNYSGCAVDIGKCEECGWLFEVSYKIDKIKEWK